MLYFSKLRIIFITLFSLLFVAIASSNLFKFDDVFFDKKINLGLDLQGGSYLLLEIDNAPVIEQKLQNLTTTIRNYFKEKNIKVKNINEVTLNEKNHVLNILKLLIKEEITLSNVSFRKNKLNHIVATYIDKHPINEVQKNKIIKGVIGGLSKLK